MLYCHSIDVVGFCDSYKSGKILLAYDGLMVEKPILDIEKIRGKGYFVVILIADYGEVMQISKKLNEMEGVNLVSLEQMLYSEKDVISANREYIAENHIDEMNEYFTVAEDKEHMDVFWKSDSLFYQLFSELNL